MTFESICSAQKSATAVFIRLLKCFISNCCYAAEKNVMPIGRVQKPVFSLEPPSMVRIFAPAQNDS